ncbi:MBOAT family protein [candidate division KSB1 bacterium]|nr:MBOAT family protein [candidate division KSB1 bacterium]RQW06281.1 MAG: MBOAT family protein [candidate division KSB1 bacterium]
MLFHSLEFAFFFIAIVTLYFTVAHRYRWVLLLVGSYFFYMCWNWKYSALIIISTVVDYYAGRRMAVLPDKRSRRKYLMLSLFTNLGLLFTFKYFNFFAESLNQTLLFIDFSTHIPHLNVLLPVGISFYTFQTLSYSIDVYRGKVEHEQHFGIFALYVSFFPQLVAGPIERAGRLLPQLHTKNFFDEARFVSGLRLMLWGLFKKIAIANRLAIYVDAVYGNADLHNGVTLLFATYLFAFQIYCDFSGYSDIAIGAARVLGYDLMRNFRRPYFAKTINEFWHRWHISLSTWFRDYLYIPLGGNRKGLTKMLLNMIIVFIVSGMWHGANWTFLIWGVLHGVFAVMSKVTLPWRDRFVAGKLPRALVVFFRMFVTFHLVCLAWIFFRADSITEANFIIQQIVTFPGRDLFIPEFDKFSYGIFVVVFLLFVESAQEWLHLSEKFIRRPRAIRWLSYVAIFVVLVLIGVFDESQFIYFQF